MGCALQKLTRLTTVTQGTVSFLLPGLPGNSADPNGTLEPELGPDVLWGSVTCSWAQSYRECRGFSQDGDQGPVQGTRVPGWVQKADLSLLQDGEALIPNLCECELIWK